MQDFASSFSLAFGLISGVDADLLEIIGLSLRVSVTAVLISAVIGLPLGAAIAVMRFRGRRLLDILLNALMGLPPVVVGLIVYMLVSRAGPFGYLNILYTPTAMIIAQVILIVPIISALTRQIVEDLHIEYDEQFRSLCLPVHRVITALIWDARYSLLTVVLAGFGRAIAEVGAGDYCRRQYSSFNPHDDYLYSAGNIERESGACACAWHDIDSAVVDG